MSIGREVPQERVGGLARARDARGAGSPSATSTAGATRPGASPTTACSSRRGAPRGSTRACPLGADGRFARSRWRRWWSHERRPTGNRAVRSARAVRDGPELDGARAGGTRRCRRARPEVGRAGDRAAARLGAAAAGRWSSAGASPGRHAGTTTTSTAMDALELQRRTSWNVGDDDRRLMLADLAHHRRRRQRGLADRAGHPAPRRACWRRARRGCSPYYAPTLFQAPDESAADLRDAL